MSVEKFKPEMSFENQSYTILPNSVIQHIKFAEAFLVWSYLLSRPHDWDVIKTHIKKIYGYGDAKIKKIFKFLSDNNLIKYIRGRDENGRLTKVEIRVLNGSLFMADNEKNCNEINNPTTGSENHPVVNHTSGFGGTTKERLLQSKELQRESSLSDDFQPNASHQKICLQKHLDLNQVLKKFRNHAKSKNLKSFDWDASFNNWVINERETDFKNDRMDSIKPNLQTVSQALAPIETPEQQRLAFQRRLMELGIYQSVN